MRDYGEGVTAIWGGDPECEHKWGRMIPRQYEGGGNRGVPEEWQRPSREAHIGESNSNFCVLCGAWRGQLGLEPHPNLYIKHMVMICRELKRVLKKSGTFWLNMGDTYCGGGTHHGKWKESGKHRLQKGQDYMSSTEPQASGNLEMNGAWLQPKQKMMMPARLAIALQHDGWILRNEIVWFKPNHMPSSVKDRLTNAWESVFLFSKSRRYWFDLDVIRKPHKQSTIEDLERRNRLFNKQSSERPFSVQAKDRSREEFLRPSGKNPGDVWKIEERPEIYGKNPSDVWRIPAYPFPEAHFATFPPKLIEPMILAGCPRQICKACGVARTRKTKIDYDVEGGVSENEKQDPSGLSYTGTDRKFRGSIKVQTVGWSDCGCHAGWRPGIVLDPFVGSGTVPLVAQKLSRAWIGIELKPEYVEMAKNRIMKECSQKLEKWITI